MLSDHLPKCGKTPSPKKPVESNGRRKEPLNDREDEENQLRNGRARSRENLNKRSPVKWNRSRDRLGSRDRLEDRGRSRSRDALNNLESNRNKKSRGRSQSAENLVDTNIDLAREIERDIERINFIQGELYLVNTLRLIS